MNRLSSLMLLSGLSGVYSGVLKVSVGIWLNQLGVDLVYLGLLSLIFLPYSFKVFWVPFFDSIQSPLKRFFGVKKGWIVFLNIISVFMIFLLSFFNPLDSMFQFICFLLVYSCVTATYEAIALGYQMETVKPSEWGPWEGTFMIAYHTGFWMGGIGCVLASIYFPWSSVYFFLSILLCFFVPLVLRIPDSSTKVKLEKTVWGKFSAPFKDFISRNKSILFSLFAFIAFYRLQDRILASMLNYFVLDSGFSKASFVMAKSLGLVCMALGGLIGSAFVKKLGYGRTLVYGIVWHGISSSLFLVVALFPSLSWLLYSAVAFEKVARGFESTVFFTYQMIFCNKNYGTTQIVLLVAVDRLTGGLIGSTSGFIAEKFGWPIFFAFSFIGSLPALYFMKKLPHEIEEEKE